MAHTPSTRPLRLPPALALLLIPLARISVNLGRNRHSGAVPAQRHHHSHHSFAHHHHHHRAHNHKAQSHRASIRRDSRSRLDMYLISIKKAATAFKIPSLVATHFTMARPTLDMFKKSKMKPFNISGSKHLFLTDVVWIHLAFKKPR